MEKGAKNVIILGAAGRDFHVFNVMFRKNKRYKVAAFTANQIPFISGRTYPKELSGRLYPKGIKIYDESELPELIRDFRIDVCVMAYSDLRYQDVMEKASIANAEGADFWLVSPAHTMLRSSKPVIAVCGVRTGVGKSQTSRYISIALRNAGFKVALVRHPMPYGILKEQVLQRFASIRDLDRYKTTIEEREDYEPHIKNGFVVYAGVDYEKVLRRAEAEADIIVWDGGNNDAPFIKPDFMVVVADPLRAGDELTYYPGETVARMADLFVVNKVNSAKKEDVERVVNGLKSINSKADVLLADSVLSVDNPNAINGKKVLVVEDGPTITHGGMLFGAATVAAKEYGAKEIINAKKYAVGTLKDVFARYPRLYNELPAVGYSPKQVRDLEATINAAECDLVISATPTDIRHILNANKPIVQVYYELRPHGVGLDEALEKFARKRHRQ
ncbi:MAG: cyclic 2,3-diphosphoglycerate synthase [Candidatus Micrarchaeaceae archaeon]